MQKNGSVDCFDQAGQSILQLMVVITIVAVLLTITLQATLLLQKSQWEVSEHLAQYIHIEQGLAYIRQAIDNSQAYCPGVANQSIAKDGVGGPLFQLGLVPFAKPIGVFSSKSLTQWPIAKTGGGQQVSGFKALAVYAMLQSVKSEWGVSKGTFKLISNTRLPVKRGDYIWVGPCRAGELHQLLSVRIRGKRSTLTLMQPIRHPYAAGSQLIGVVLEVFYLGRMKPKKLSDNKSLFNKTKSNRALYVYYHRRRYQLVPHIDQLNFMKQGSLLMASISVGQMRPVELYRHIDMQRE